VTSLTRMDNNITNCSKRVLKPCKHSTTTDVMSGHKNVVRTSSPDKQGHNDVV